MAYSPSMRILIIGGTHFVGHAMAEAAQEYLPYLESAARRALQLVDRLAE